MPPKILRLQLFAALIVILAAIPSYAAGKRRAVKHPSTSIEFKITGLVLDDVSGTPIVSVEVTAGDRNTTTGADGTFTLEMIGSLPLNVALQRSGYVTKSVTLNTAGDHDLTVRLTPTASVRVKRTNGVELDFDYESIEFGYPLIFGGYIKAAYEEFCRGDGSEVTIDRSEIRKITGPAVLATQTTCCSAQQLLRVTVELKSGVTSELYFKDSCSSTTVDLIGREHVSGIFRFIRFVDIAEVVFP